MVIQCNISTQEDHNTKFFLIILLFRIRNVFFFKELSPPFLITKTKRIKDEKAQATFADDDRGNRRSSD